MLVERITDELTSIGNDAATLLSFKGHCALPPEASWTESDPRLKAYLLAAEIHVDQLGGVPYRPRTFRLSFPDFIRLKKPGSCQMFKGFRLPFRPVDLEEDVTIDWTDDDAVTGIYDQDDFTVYGPNSLSPEIIFPGDFTPESTATVPYPYVVTYTTAASELAAVALIAIFELAAYYYRYPEAISDKNVNAGQIYQANIDFLKGSFL